MHETMMTIEKMAEAKKTFLDWLCAEMAKGEECFDGRAGGALTDMIKGLAEAEEKCMKAKYYEVVIGEMLDYDSEEDDEMGRYGYDNYRYASGRFAPKGRGRNVGHGSRLKMGYPLDPHTHPGADRWDDYDRIIGHDPMRYPYGYPEDQKDGRKTKSSTYDEYKRSKMGYTQTHTDQDHRQMNDHILEATMETAEDMKEMWNDASPETKARMKANLSSLLKEWEKN